MIHRSQWVAAAAACLAAVALAPQRAAAQSYLGVSYGYNFAGQTGCRSATDCQNRNWNWGGSAGVFGKLFGFEIDLTHEGHFTGDHPNPTSVTTLMGDLMLAPRIPVVQPYGLAGLGAIRTTNQSGAGANDSAAQFGWTVGAGVIVHVQKHIGIKGDVRYYHAFQALNVVGVDLSRGDKIDFGRAAFGVLFKF